MNFEFRKEYIVKISEEGIIPIEEFDSDRFYDKDHDDLDFLTDEEKMVVINNVLDKIRAEIECNMESIIGKYDSSIPKFNMPSYKIERNKTREECISIIDKYKAESEKQA